MADFGLAGFPARPEGVDRLTHFETVIDSLPDAFSTVWISDHFQPNGQAVPEGWTLLTYLAASFPRFRFGHLVLGQSYRNPALVASMAATLQELTGGRYILGLGAGWLEEEYRAYGYDYPRGGIRVAQLAEAIEIIRAMWTTSPATYHGTHYRIDGACCLQPCPPPPILVGTNGPRCLGVVARLADAWAWDGPWETVYRRPYEILRQHCDDLGRPFDDIDRTCSLTVRLPDDPGTFEPTYTHSFYPGQVFDILGPTPASVIREIDQLVDLGVSHFQVDVGDLATLRRFVDEIVPACRLDRVAPRTPE